MLKRSKKSGFTLLELLIVVIVVSILAGVALPRFGKMTLRAKLSEAQNTIGAILTAEDLYYQENQKFADAYTDLLVEFDTTKFTYDAPALAPGPPKTATVKATGTAAGPGTSVEVTGVVDSTSKRSFSNNQGV